MIGIHTQVGKALERFWLEEKEEILEIDVEERPLLVRFDDGNYLLKEWTFRKSTDELLYHEEDQLYWVYLDKTRDKKYDKY